MTKRLVESYLKLEHWVPPPKNDLFPKIKSGYLEEIEWKDIKHKRRQTFRDDIQ